MKIHNILAIAFMFIVTFASGMGKLQKPTAEDWTRFVFAVSKDYTVEVENALKKFDFSADQLVSQLMFAIHCHAEGSVALLLQYGCPVNRDKDDKSLTPLYSAIREGNKTIVKWLLMCGVDALRKEGPHWRAMSPLALAQELAHRPGAKGLRKEIFALIQAPQYSDYFTGNSILALQKREIGIQKFTNTIKVTSETLYKAVCHRDLPALKRCFKELAAKDHAEQIKEINDALKEALWMNQFDAVDILLAWGSTETLKTHFPNCVKFFNPERTKYCIKQRCISIDTIENELQEMEDQTFEYNSRRKLFSSEPEFVERKRKMVAVLSSPGHIILEEETGQRNISQALMHRQLGLKKFKK